MALTGTLEGARLVALDTSVFIYLVEKHVDFFPKVEPIFAAVDAGEVRGVTSVLTLLEALVRPLEVGAADLAEEFRLTLLASPHLQVLSVDPVVAELAADVRARHGYRTPDAIHLATAQHAGADVFITNDAKLVSFPGVRVVSLDKLP